MQCVLYLTQKEVTIFGGIIGIAVDRSTGAGCQYPQQNIYYPMKKASQ